MNRWRQIAAVFALLPTFAVAKTPGGAAAARRCTLAGCCNRAARSKPHAILAASQRPRGGLRQLPSAQRPRHDRGQRAHSADRRRLSVSAENPDRTQAALTYVSNARANRDLLH